MQIFMMLHGSGAGSTRSRTAWTMRSWAGAWAFHVCYGVVRGVGVEVFLGAVEVVDEVANSTERSTRSTIWTASAARLKFQTLAASPKSWRIETKVWSRPQTAGTCRNDLGA